MAEGGIETYREFRQEAKTRLDPSSKNGGKKKVLEKAEAVLEASRKRLRKRTPAGVTQEETNVTNVDAKKGGLERTHEGA